MIIAIGLKKEDLENLKLIASFPHKENMFTFQNYK